jgi:hypothetical protein
MQVTIDLSDMPRTTAYLRDEKSEAETLCKLMFAFGLMGIAQADGVDIPKGVGLEAMGVVARIAEGALSDDDTP